jgi:hypothetical protein
MDHGSWSDSMNWMGRVSRAMRNYGSPFHKVAGVLAVERADTAGAADDVSLSIDSWSSEPSVLEVSVYHGRHLLAQGVVSQTANAWCVSEIAVPIRDDGGAGSAFLPTDSGAFGAGDIVIRGAEFVDARGAATYALAHGSPASLLVHYEILNPALAERAQVSVGFHRDGVQDVCRFIARDLCFDAQRRTGVVRLNIPSMQLTDGTYTVSVMIAKEGYYDREQATFYTINPEVYSARARLFEVMVVGAGLIGSGTVAVASGQWTLE